MEGLARMKGIVLLVGVALAALALSPALGAQALAGPPKVLCLTKLGGTPRGDYRQRPRSCDLHQRGAPPVRQAIAVTRRLEWSQWGGRVAIAKGKIGISSVGLVPLKLRLTRPRSICGRTVYTKAEFVVTTYDGERNRSSWQIDSCLR